MTPQRFTEIFARIFPNTSPRSLVSEPFPFWFEPYHPDVKQLWWSDQEILMVASEVLREFNK